MTNPAVEYCRVSPWAVASAICGATSAMGLLVPVAAVIAAGGVFAGIIAIHLIRKYEFAGLRLAGLGIASSVAFAVATPIWDNTQFNAESLPGYARLDFASLTKSGTGRLEAFSGENVCLKGYAVVPDSNSETDQFVLSPNGEDRNTEALVIVELCAGTTWRWRDESLSVSGKLVLNPLAKEDSTLPRYMLTASTVRPTRTSYGLVHRTDSKGC